MHNDTDQTTPPDRTIHAFSRNRYYYGKLLDVRHFESEQTYFNRKRWLINRLVNGYGVVCGLDVVAQDGKIHVEPGVALDQAGREIVVPFRSRPVELPLRQAENQPGPGKEPDEDEDDGCADGDWVHVCIAFHECATSPEPVHVGGPCDEAAPSCAAGAVSEGYRILLRPGKAQKIGLACELVDVIAGGRLSYKVLVDYVTRDCAPVPEAPCVPLANVRLAAPDDARPAPEIDITVRPIVYTNDLLFELLLCVCNGAPNRPRGGKS